MDTIANTILQQFRDRMTQAEIDEALVLAIEADKREIEALREEAAMLRQQLQAGWRDVADELPQEAQEVLFVRGGKTVHGAWIGGIFWHSNQKMAAAKWMPLPLPPKPDVTPMMESCFVCGKEYSRNRQWCPHCERKKTADDTDQQAKRLRAELAATQAREKVLRDALVEIGDSACGEACHQYVALRALALPADDTALREMLARAQEEMRERCAATCERIAVKHVDAEMEGLADGSWDDSDHYRSSGDWRATAENHAKATGWMMLQCAAAIRKLEVKQ